MESTGEMTTAIQFYEAAQDFLSLVRVYCYCADVDKVSWLSLHLWGQYKDAILSGYEFPS